jgi:hypothetical protein
MVRDLHRLLELIRLNLISSPKRPLKPSPIIFLPAILTVFRNIYILHMNIYSDVVL